MSGSATDGNKEEGTSNIGSLGTKTVLGLLMTEAKIIPMAESTAPPRKAYRKPSTVAAAGVTDAPRLATTTPTIVTAIARPMGPPTSVAVVMSPDARPSSPFLAPLSAAILNAVKLVAAPSETRSIAGRSAARYVVSSQSWLSRQQRAG